MLILAAIACSSPSPSTEKTAGPTAETGRIGDSGGRTGDTSGAGSGDTSVSAGSATCVWVVDPTGSSRFEATGVLQERSSCTFVGVGPDGRAYRDGVGSVEVVDPGDCEVLESVPLLDLPYCAPDYTSGSGAFGYFSEPTLRAVTFDGEARFFAYDHRECGPAYYLRVVTVDRTDRSGHVYRVQETPPTDVAVGGEAVYLVRPEGVVVVDASASVDPTWPYPSQGAPLPVAGVPRRAEFGPDGALYLLNALGAVTRYDASGSATVLEADGGSRTDLAFLPDGRLLVATGDAVDAFDGVTGAVLGRFASSGGATLGVADCP